jgi:catechol 2,3-dioxygenase-like lactoylglutathione lyase family enzyme
MFRHDFTRQVRQHSTSDQDRALKFWTDVVGFRVLTDQPFSETQRWIELRIGSSDTRIVLFTADEGTRPGSPFNGALACDNVEQTYRSCRRVVSSS